MLIISESDEGGCGRSVKDVQDSLDCNAPFLSAFVNWEKDKGNDWRVTHVCDVAHDFGNLERDGLTLCDHRLDGAGTNDMTKGRLSTLDKGLTKIRDAATLAVSQERSCNRSWNLQSGAVGVDDLSPGLEHGEGKEKIRLYLEIDHRINLHVDVIAGDDSLSANGADLYFDIHNTEGLGAHVDVGKTRVDSFIEVSKAGHKPHRPYFMTASAGARVQRGLSHTLLHVAEWVGKGAARNSTQASDTCAQAMNHGSVHTMRNILDAHVLRVRGLAKRSLEVAA